MLVQFGNNWIKKILQTAKLDEAVAVLRIFLIQLFPNWTACSLLHILIILMINKSYSRCAVVRFCYQLYDYRPNWTPLSPITITKLNLIKLIQGPKLTFLGRCQLATEFFLSRHMEKCGCQKVSKEQKNARGLLRPQYYVMGNR